jgi:predicted DNA-binding protein (MmcQ/YjbR family)
MKYADIEKYCLSLPGATLTIQHGWGDERVYKVGGKMFAAISAPQTKPQLVSFKAAPDSFAILTKEKDVIPAPYAARYYWVQLKKLDALGVKELKAYLTRAHAIIAAGLPRKKRAELGMD